MANGAYDPKPDDVGEGELWRILRRVDRRVERVDDTVAELRGLPSEVADIADDVEDLETTHEEDVGDIQARMTNMLTGVLGFLGTAGIAAAGWIMGL